MSLGSSEAANFVSLLAFLISAAGMIFSIRDRRNVKFQIMTEYTNQLLAWHGRVVEVLIELRCPEEHVTSTRRAQLLNQLSALIEQGRFYFPNIKTNEFGNHNPPAYRGYRNIALDFLVACYNIHHDGPCTEELANHATQLQRLFTSVVFEVVSPTYRLEQIRKITDRYLVKNLSAEDLQRGRETDAIRYMWHKST